MVQFGIEILNFLSGEFLVLRQVKIGTAVNSFHLLKSERHFKFDVGSGIGIMRQFIVIVEAVFIIAHTEVTMPFHTHLFPLFEPFQLFARTNEELHLHLFEFAHAEDELPRHDLVTERFPDLCNAER